MIKIELRHKNHEEVLYLNNQYAESNCRGFSYAGILEVLVERGIVEIIDKRSEDRDQDRFE